MKKSLYFGLNGGTEAGSWRAKQSVTKDETLYEINSSGFSTGTNFSAVAAFTTRNLMVGVEYGKSQLQFSVQKDEENSLDDSWSKGKADGTRIFGLLGYKTLGNERAIWFGFAPIHELEFKENYNPEDTSLKYEGTAYKIGIGENFAKHFRLNVEYIYAAYEKVTREETTQNLPATFNGFSYDELKSSTILISLSINVNFFNYPPFYPFHFTRDYEY